MSQKFSLMLFAAGLGTRMGALTKHQPKPLVKVGSTTLLNHALDISKHPRINQRVINVHHFADQIRAETAEQDLIISDETDLLRETGGGLKHALDVLAGDPVMTMNTDAVWSDASAVTTLINNWHDHMEGLLLIAHPERVRGHPGLGDFDIGPRGQLSRGGAYVYTGLQLIRTERVSAVKQDVFSMNVVWDQMLAAGTLFGAVYRGIWCDVGVPSSLPLAEDILGKPVDV